MKKVIVCSLTAVVLVPLVFLIYSAWWIDHTYKLYAPAMGYCAYTSLTLANWCRQQDTCCVNCLRDLMHSDHIFRIEINENLLLLTPPKQIKHLGFLIAKDLRMPDDSAIPILVCKTPLDSVRREEGDPPGKNHLAGFAGTSFRKMTPDEFISLDKSLFIDIEILLKEMQNISSDSN